ncbi:MAG TPA: Wzz/FepE/Etk N-terminal domain-containing protein [Anaerolineae bacterium]|nr:Wzz/FepE/Etk N-terminal domain-containing protein [Anaerolineae bacterium]
MKNQQYLQTLWQDWWIIVAIVLVTTGLGLAYSYAQTPIYEATATFVVNPGVRIAETYDLVYSINTLTARTSLATTYSNILESRTIFEAAAETLNLPPEIIAAYEANSVVLPDSNVLLLQVQGPSPDLAADLANAIGEAGLEYVAGLQEVYELRRLDPAATEPEPVSPNRLADILLGLTIGLLGGLAFVILRRALSQPFGEQRLVLNPTPLRSEIDSPEVKNVKNVGSKTALQTNFSPSQPD